MKMSQSFLKKVMVLLCSFIFAFCSFQSSFAQTTVTIGPGANWTDALIQSTVSTNQAHAPHFAAYAWTESGAAAYKRSLVKFNFSSLPEGATILNAKLYLYSDPTVTGSVAWNGNSQHSGSNAVYFEKVTSNWSETSVIWNNQPPTTTSGRIWFPGSTSTTENIQVDLTSFVQQWMDYPTTNFGMKMRLENEAYYRSRTYASEEHSNTSIRPKLVVTFLPPVSGVGDGCGTASMDSATIVNQPWFANNQYLTDYINNNPNYSGNKIASCTNCRGVTPAYFRVPVKALIYRRDDGSMAHDGITKEQVEDVIQRTNKIYRDAGTGIQFYLSCDIGYKNNTNFYEDIDSRVGTSRMFKNNKYFDNVTLHFIRTNNNGFGGRAQGKGEIGSWSAVVNTDHVVNGSLEFKGFPRIASTLAHELGHVFGLSHTHDPGRAWWRWDVGNGGCGKCYQESVDRDLRQNDGGGFCWDSWLNHPNPRKCEMNGDLLCDTDADPTLIASNVSSHGATPPCEYTGGGTDEWGNVWNPPTTNVMSYTASLCRSTFSPFQISIMSIGITEFFDQYNISGDVYFDEYEPDNFWENATILNINQIQDHTIHPSTGTSSISCDEDWVRFIVYNTEDFKIQTMPVSNQSNVDTYMELYKIDVTTDGSGLQTESLGSLIVSNDNADGYYSKIVRSLSPGRYAVKIRGNDAVDKGYYSIALANDCFNFTNQNTTISGNSTTCGSNEYYSIQNFAQGSTYNWVVSNNLNIEAGGTTNTIYVSNYGTGSGTVDVTVTSASGCTYTAPTKTIQLGNPSWSDATIQGPSSACFNSTLNFSVPYYSGSVDNDYQWETQPYSQNISISGQGTRNISMFIYYSTNAPTYYNLKVTAQGPCGEIYTMKAISVQDCGGNTYSLGSYNYYPNPPDDELTVSLKEDDSSISDEKYAQNQNKEFEVKLVGNKGKTIRSKKSKNEKSLKIKTDDLANGLYYLHIIDEKEIVKKQILIEH